MASFCPDCDALLDGVPPDYACPSCGGMRRSVEAGVQPATGTLRTGPIRVEVTQGAWKKNWLLVLVVAALTLGSPFLSRLLPELSGWTAVGVGEVLNLLSNVLGFYAVTRIVTITRT